MTPDEWHDLVRGMLRAEMSRRGITYDQLVAKLAEIGVNEQPKSLYSKVARGGFSAVFFMQCLRAIGCRSVNIDQMPPRQNRAPIDWLASHYIAY